MRRENVLLVTIDSCRLDTAQKADLAGLPMLGQCIPSWSNATFTLPAHHAILAGFLPSHPPGSKLLGGYDRVWRSRAARRSHHDVYQPFQAKNIVDAYIDAGWDVSGMGGVQFFDTGVPENSLPAMFPRFTYLSGATDSLLEDEVVPDGPASVLAECSRELVGAEPFFRFINFPETHFPYWTPNQEPVTRESVEVLREARMFMNTKSVVPQRHPLVVAGGVALMHGMQVRALEFVDAQLKSLFESLLRDATLPTLVVVCADHGESFGEDGRLGHGHPARSVMDIPMWVGRLDPMR